MRLWSWGVLLAACCTANQARIGVAQSTNGSLVFNRISVRLDADGVHSLSSDEVTAIAAGSSSAVHLTNLTVEPSTFTFCQLGDCAAVLTAIDATGTRLTCNGMLDVCAPAPPAQVFVNPSYGSDCRAVGGSSGKSGGPHFVGFDAFATIQAAVEAVAEGGAVYVAPGCYAENVMITKPLFLLGPNAGLAGFSLNRTNEAKVIPARSDPENSPIISVESDGVVIDGLMLDGSNSNLAGGYDANGVRVHAAAGVQNGVYPDLADVAAITIRNNIVTNISYEGVCLDRYQYFGTSSAWNYIRNNYLINMWEGILTYSVDSVIAHNVISNVTHGLGVHCVTTAAPKGFSPSVVSNVVSMGHWWPVEIDVARAPGIWINFRREHASPLLVKGNEVRTPVSAPPLKQLIGLYALTVEDQARVQFLNNSVEGYGNCHLGFLSCSCWSNHAVTIERGAFKEIRTAGVLADTLDARWGAGDTCVTVTSTEFALTPGAVGVLARQTESTSGNTATVTVLGSCKISGGACGVQVWGSNACASVVGNAQVISGNDVGIDVVAGRALVQGNILTNNHSAGLLAENGGVVDAGDCLGGNVSGLGSGKGENGASAGENDLSGYGCDGVAPWAIRNTGMVPVLADRNVFNTRPNEDLWQALSGPVSFSDTTPLAIAAPRLLKVQCLKDVPPGPRNVAEFIAAGGAIITGAATSVTFSDSIFTNSPGWYTVTRRYAVSGGCGRRATCQQEITALDQQPPTLHCSENILVGVDRGCDFATVTFTNVAADSCGELLGTWEPVATGRFPIGTNTVIVIATDLANNSSACSFDVQVIGPPAIVKHPHSRTNNVGTTASFDVVAVSAAPITYRWFHDGVVLQDVDRVSGATTAQLSIAQVNEGDAGDYHVEVSNLGGTISSAKARLTVTRPAGALRILEYTPATVTLRLDWPRPDRFAIQTSTNLVAWEELYTNAAPFIVVHTNSPWINRRFYRARSVDGL